MALTFNIFFKWNRDDAYEAMNDEKLADYAKELMTLYDPKKITPSDIRELNYKLAERNELLAIEQLKTFMKEDYNGLPRYVRYVQSILEYGLYCHWHELDPSKNTQFIDSFKITSESYGVEIEFTIPEQFRIEDFDRDAHLKEIMSFRESLADGLWEGSPGSEAVHYSCATVTYSAW
jgi:hypothetical protein